MELFSDTSGYGGYVRNHSGSTAAIAQELMRDLAPALLDGAYLCGLMHDVGKLLLMASGEHIYTDPAGDELTTPDTAHLIERGELGYDHAALGGQVLWHWKFPEPVPQVVAFHHSPELARTEKEAGMLTSVLRIADQLEPSIGAEDDRRESVAQALAEGGDGTFARVSADYILEKWERLVELKGEALKLFG